MKVFVSPEQKKILRKIKVVSSGVKAIVYGGNLAGLAATIQFNSDVRLYGMYEALLYVEGYEEQGMYQKGTADKALTEALLIRNQWFLAVG